MCAVIDRAYKTSVKTSSRQILFSFTGAITFMLLAISIGWGDAVAMPIGRIFLDILPNYGHDPRTALILLLPPTIFYAAVFWTVGMIWSMLAKRYRRER